jgi:hypothetical protein
MHDSHMKRDRRLAGVGGIAFAVALVAGFTLYGPKGGQYSAAEIGAFVAQSSSSLAVSAVLFGVSVIGLFLMLAYLSGTYVDEGPYRRVAWGMSLAAGASVLIGWALYLASPIATHSGGPAIDPAVSYALISAGFAVLFGVGGLVLGIALVSVAMGGSAAPTWVRGLSGLAGLSALLAWAFLLASNWSPNQWLPVPFYLVVLWGLVIGVWLVISRTHD